MNPRLLTCLLIGTATAAQAAELRVGPGLPFDRIEPALAAAQPGDTILVHPQQGNEPYSRVALYVTKPRITIRAATLDGERIPLSGRGFDYAGSGSTPRAIVQFNRGADGCVIEGFELFDARNRSHNGAGVRINQANNVTVRHCTIRNNDMGIMSNGDGPNRSGADQVIEGCLIHSNGSTSHPGFNHNLYLGGTSVLLRGCEIHSSVTGHNVKSRAHLTVVWACYVHDSANREFDLVDAAPDTTISDSDAFLVGNVIVKSSAGRGNHTVIHFGQDIGHGRNGTLYLVHNTIVTPYSAPVVDLSSAETRARLFNNVIWDGGDGPRRQVLADTRRASAGDKAVDGAANWLASGYGGAATESPGLRQTFVAAMGESPPWTDHDKGNYRLSRPAPSIVQRGLPLPREVARRVGARLEQYVAPQDVETRPRRSRPDLGAYEFVANQRAER
ncbi:MAG: hypothetical protein WD069_19875 [Planctomycetales bacterium]